MPNGLNPDQDYVGPDLSPNCLPMLSGDDKRKLLNCNRLHGLSNSYTLGCPPVRRDNP